MGKIVKDVQVLDVQKRRTPSKHYVYVMSVTWSDGSVIDIFRRYSAFFEMHIQLLDRFPKDAGEDGETERIIPFLPGKKLFGRSHTHKVALSRKSLLEEYLKALIKLPSRIIESYIVTGFFDASAQDIKPPSAEQREKKPASILSKLAGTKEEIAPQKEMQVGEVMVLEQYHALSDFKAETKTQLSFKGGDILEVLEKKDSGWWLATNENDKSGWVPGTYLEPVETPDEEPHAEPIPKDGDTYISIAPYKATQDDEIGFEKGVVVKVLSKSLDGWWTVSYQGKVGQTPGQFLEKIESAGQVNGKAAPARPVERPKRPAQSKSALSVSEYAAPPRRSSISRPLSLHKEMGNRSPAKNGQGLAAQLSSVLGGKPAGNTKPSGPSRPAGPSKPSGPKPSNGSANKPSRPGAGPSKDDEYVTTDKCDKTDDSTIQLPKGVTVKVLEKSDTGWWYVEYKGKEGWAPEDFLEKASSKKSSIDVKSTLKPAKPATPSASNKPSIKSSSGSVSGMAAALTSSLKPTGSTSHGLGAAKPTVKPNLKPDKPALPSNTSKPALKPVTSANKPVLPSAAAKPALKPATISKPATPSKPSGGGGGGVKSLAALLGGSGPGGGSRPSIDGKPAFRPSTGAKPKPAVTGAKPAIRPSFGVKPATPNKPTKPDPVGAKPRPGTVSSASNTIAAALNARLGSVGGAPKPAGGAVKPGRSSPTYVANDSYQKESESEVSLRKGETLTVSEKNDTGWWFVKNSKGEEGWAPSDFVEEKGSSPSKPVKPVAPVKPMATAKPIAPAKPVAPVKPKGKKWYTVDDYKAESDGELSFKKNQIAEITERAEGWWYAKIGSKEGWIPSDFVEER